MTTPTQSETETGISTSAEGTGLGSTAATSLDGRVSRLEHDVRALVRDFNRYESNTAMLIREIHGAVTKSAASSAPAPGTPTGTGGSDGSGGGSGAGSGSATSSAGGTTTPQTSATATPANSTGEYTLAALQAALYVWANPDLRKGWTQFLPLAPALLSTFDNRGSDEVLQRAALPGLVGAGSVLANGTVLR